MPLTTMGDLIGDVREAARVAIDDGFNREWQLQHPNASPPRWGDAGPLRVDVAMVDRIAAEVAARVVRKLVATWLLTEDEANELRGAVDHLARCPELGQNALDDSVANALMLAISRLVGSSAAGARPA